MFAAWLVVPDSELLIYLLKTRTGYLQRGRPVCAGAENFQQHGDRAGSAGAASEAGSEDQPLLSSLLSPGRLPEVRACLFPGPGGLVSCQSVTFLRSANNGHTAATN